MTALHEQGLQIKYSPLGHAQVTVGLSAVGLSSIPNLSRVRRIVIRNLGQPINWRDDGTDPTGTTGMVALKDEILVYDGDKADQFKMIRNSAATGDADVRIAYYGV